MGTACAAIPRSTTAGPVIAFGAAIVVTVEFVVIGLSPLMAQALGMPLQASGRFVVWFAIGSAVMGPFAALVARRLQARDALLLALLPYVANVGVPWLNDADALCLLRFVQGATLPLYVGAGSDALSRLWRRDDKAVARIYLGVTVGSVLGAPAGVFLAQQVGWRGTFVCLGALALIAIALVGVQRSLRELPAADVSVKRQLTAVVRGGVLAHLLLSLVHFAAMFCCYAFLGAILRARGADENAVAGLLLVFGMGGLAGNLLAGRMTARSTRLLSIVAAAAIALTPVALTRLPGSAGAGLAVWLALLLWGAAHAASFVVCQLRVVRAAPAAPRLASALNIAAANVGIAIGPVLGGRWLDDWGFEGLTWAGSVLGLASLTLACVLRHVERLDASKG